MVQLLLENSVDINKRFTGSDITPLIVAAARGYHDTLLVLLKHGRLMFSCNRV